MQIIPFPAARVAARPANNPTINALIPSWRTARLADGYRPRGVASYIDKIKDFADWAGVKGPRAITEDMIARYKIALYERGLVSGTVRVNLTVVRAFCAWCKLHSYMETNPALAVPHPKVEAPNPDPLRRAEIDQLLAAIDAPPRSHKATWRRNRRAVMIGLYTGCRIAEIAELRWFDIDLERGEMIVRKQGAKGGKSRVVPICAELDVELRAAGPHRQTDAVVDQGDGTPLHVKSLAHIFERWLVKRGITIHAHQLRKTFATELYVAGEDLVTIQRLLGHSDPKTTMRYLGASAPKERAAVQKLVFRTRKSGG